jgi:two-component system NtrC family sensor kinase
VASGWRIRHKLMLGLGLVVGTMVLLLGGTLCGLWSYYVDMNSLRGKTVELRLAEEFKTAVSHVARRAEDPKNLRQKRQEWRTPEAEAGPASKTPFLLPLPGAAALESPVRKNKPTTLHEAIAEANKRLDEYEQEAVNHDLNSATRDDARGLIANLRKAFAELNEKAKKLEDPHFGLAETDSKLMEHDRNLLADQVAGIERDTGDLCDLITHSMERRINDSRRNYQVTLWITVPASVGGLLLICGLLGSFYAWVFHPIRDLEVGVGQIARGDLAHRIEVHSGDEMEDLGHAFNDMMQRLQDLYSDLARQVNERSRQLVRSERLASVGFLAAGVAHEINNPLASIAFCSEALESRLSDLLRHLRATGRAGEEQEVFAKYLKMIQDEAFRCKNITEKLLAFSRTSERRREAIDLRELVQSVLDITQHLPNHRNKNISFEISADRLANGQKITAWGNSEEIKQVVLNLVMNGLESMDEGGRLNIRLAQRGDMAELQFTDSGCGMTQEVLENIFEPFYTRSRTGKGTGLGLTISHRIITQHGGEIEVTSPGPNKGSTFTVRLPIQPPEESVLPGPGLDKSDEQAAPDILRLPKERAA